MRFIRRLLTAIVVIVVLLVAVAYVLPREVSVARSVTIDAPPEAIFPHVNSLQKMADWSPWLDRDPNVKLTYEGPEMGVGNKLTWASDQPDVGNGIQEITAMVENEKVTTALDFGDMGLAQADITLAAAGSGTEVTWSLDTDMGNNPIGRWMGLMMDKWVGADYETGLGNLKTLVEGG